jgi:hypothetical protein
MDAGYHSADNVFGLLNLGAELYIATGRSQLEPSLAQAVVCRALAHAPRADWVAPSVRVKVDQERKCAVRRNYELDLAEYETGLLYDAIEDSLELHRVGFGRRNLEPCTIRRRQRLCPKLDVDLRMNDSRDAPVAFDAHALRSTTRGMLSQKLGPSRHPFCRAGTAPLLHLQRAALQRSTQCSA